jgi:hypothetical protein
MLCHYCLQNTAPPVCGSCKEPLPALYTNRGDNPAILSVIGVQRPRQDAASGFAGNGGRTTGVARLPVDWRGYEHPVG